MEQILRKLHFFVFIYAAYAVFMGYQEHEESLDRKRTRIPVLKSKLKRLENKKRDLDNFLADIERAKSKIEKVANEIESLQKKLPSTISDPEILVNLKQVAEGLNIRNIFLSPLSETDNGFFYAKQYRFRASGTFLQFLIFLEKISENERIVNVKSVGLANLNQRQRGRFQMIDCDIILEVYRYNPRYREDRGIKEIEKKFSSL